MFISDVMRKMVSLGLFLLIWLLTACSTKEMTVNIRPLAPERGDVVIQFDKMVAFKSIHLKDSLLVKNKSIQKLRIRNLASGTHAIYFEPDNSYKKNHEISLEIDIKSNAKENYLLNAPPKNVSHIAAGIALGLVVVLLPFLLFL